MSLTPKKILIGIVVLTAGLAFLWGNTDKPEKIIQSEMANTVLIKNVRVFDGIHADLVHHNAVLLENGIISKLYQSQKHLPTALQGTNTIKVIEGNGDVLMPALIDFHAHFGMSSGRPPWDTSITNLYPVQYEYDAYLYAGVTSLVHASPVVKPPFSGQLTGPRVYTANKIITAKDGHPVPMMKSLIPWPLRIMAVNNLVVQLAVNEQNEARLRAPLEHNAHHTKIVIDGVIPLPSPKLSAPTVAKLIAISHALGKSVYVHAAAQSDAYNAVIAGADVLMHPPYQDILDGKTLKLLSKTQTPVVTTTQIWEWMIRGLGKEPPLTQLERTLMPPGTYDSLTSDWSEAVKNYRKNGFSPSYANQTIPQFHKTLLANIRAMSDNNVLMVAGTDYGVSGLTPGASLIRELHNLSALGLSNLKALQMATSLPGSILEPQSRPLGVVSEGALAELILLSDNPVNNLNAIDHVKMVFTQGRIIKPVKKAQAN